MAIGNKCKIIGCNLFVTIKRCAMCTKHRQRQYNHKSIYLPIKKMKDGIVKICPKHGELTPDKVVRTYVKRKRAINCPGFPYRDAYCKECHHQRMQKGRLKSKYGITLDEYKEMFAKQEGKCDMCKQPERIITKYGKQRKLAVDHDHKTGKNRGLLCAHCNTAIGMLRESIKTIRNTEDYLRRHGATE